MTRYLDLPGISPTSSPELARKFAIACGAKFERILENPTALKYTDTVVTGPWADWVKYPDECTLEILPEMEKRPGHKPVDDPLRLDGEKLYLREFARILKWPELRYTAVETIGAGRENWQKFIDRANLEHVEKAIEAIEKVEVTSG